MIRRLSALLALVVASFALAAGSAFAQTTPSEEVYGGQAEQIEETAGATQGSGSGPDSTSGSPNSNTQSSIPAGENSSSSDSTLPFTGSDVGTALLVGFVLLGAGLLVRRGVRTNPTA